MFLLMILATLLGMAVSAPAPGPSPSLIPAAPVVYTSPVAYSYNSFTTHPLAIRGFASPYHYYPSVGYGYDYGYAYRYPYITDNYPYSY